LLNTLILHPCSFVRLPLINMDRILQIICSTTMLLVLCLHRSTAAKHYIIRGRLDYSEYTDAHAISECVDDESNEPTKDLDREWGISVRCCSQDGNSGYSPDCDAHPKTYEEAVAVCMGFGHRLCTLEEALSGVPQSTGCHFDATYHWVSDQCGQESATPVLAGSGNIDHFSIELVIDPSDNTVMVTLKYDNYADNWWGVLFGTSMVGAESLIYTTGTASGDTVAEGLWPYTLGGFDEGAFVLNPQWTEVSTNKTGNTITVQYLTSLSTLPWLYGAVPEQDLGSTDYITSVAFRFAEGSTDDGLTVAGYHSTRSETLVVELYAVVTTQTPTTPWPTMEWSELAQAISDGNSHFGHGLSSVLYEDSTTNIWFSPWSVTSCFALLYPGSAGNTASQIGVTMRFPVNAFPDEVTSAYLDIQWSIESFYAGVDGPKSSIIGIANMLYTAKDVDLKADYVAKLENGGEVFIEPDFDFAADDAASKMNEWVSEKTEGHIEGIIADDTYIANWKLAALNAIYLNATFQRGFQAQYTSKNKFYDSVLRENYVADCHLMHNIDDFFYYHDGDYQFLKMPFHDDHVNNELFALFALPMNPWVYDQDGKWLIEDEEVIQEAIANLEHTHIAVALPKLSIETTYKLNGDLWAMGLIDAFTSSADFSGISDDPLFVDSVNHKTMIEMDEKGLLTSAVNIETVDMWEYFAKDTAILFKADHSFQMFIVDGHAQNTVLFMGQINNPGIPEGSAEPAYDESAGTIYWRDGRNFTALEQDFIAEEIGDINVDGEDLVPLFGGAMRQTGSAMNAILMTVFVGYIMLF